MAHGTTTSQLIAALCQSFCCTTITDIVWSNGRPQFTFKAFHEFAKQWGFSHRISTPHYPQSNGKIKATVKSMKNHPCVIEWKISQWWQILSSTAAVQQYALSHRWTVSLTKSSMDTLSQTYYQPIADHSPKNGNTKWKQQNNKQNKHYNLLKHTTTKMHTPSQKYKLDLMLLSTMLKQNCGIYVYGIVTHVSTHRHYCIKTPSSRVLVQKRRFLHCLIPASITVSVATADLRPHTYNRTISNTTPINKA